MTKVNPRAIEDRMRQSIEKLSDKKIDRAIKDIKERNFYGLEDCITALERAGMGLDVMLQWLEDEKFLRDHRRKYHPEAKTGGD